MALDFPNSPTSGQTFSSGSRTWVWSGTVWNLQSAPYATPTGTSFPSNPVAGQFFTRTDQKISYIYNGSAWDELSRPNPIEPLLLIGI